jgi:hypothetical protein
MTSGDRGFEIPILRAKDVIKSSGEWISSIDLASGRLSPNNFERRLTADNEMRI